MWSVYDINMDTKREPFYVSADYIDWAHGPGAESGYPMATELCALPVSRRRVAVPADRLDLVREIASVAELYTCGPSDERDPRAVRVRKAALEYLRGRGK